MSATCAFSRSAQLALALAETAPAPAGVEQLQHLGERPRTFGVVALEHLVDDYPEALMKRLSGGDSQDARELVPQRAAAVGLDVGGRQREADPLARKERPSDGSPCWPIFDRPIA